MSAAEANLKRARSSSLGSNTPDTKRPNLDQNSADMEDQQIQSQLAPAPASANLPETPVAAAQAAEAQAKQPPSMTVRALIVTQDASIIIGKSGQHIREIRDKAGAKVAVTEAVPGCAERVLVVSGPLDAVSKAYGLIVRRINDEPYDSPSAPGSRAVTIRFIIPNARMGSVIGKAGSKIKEIQDASGARLQASEAMLPNSTERILTVSGVADAIHIAIYYVGTILQEQSDRPFENRQYRPGASVRDPYRDPYDRDRDFPRGRNPPPLGRGDDRPRERTQSSYQSTADQPGSQTQQIFIPDDLVASVIGKGGRSINEIRQRSATSIKIMEPHEEQQRQAGGQPGERLVTITGLPDNIREAVSMLYRRLEEEKQKKLEGPGGAR